MGFGFDDLLSIPTGGLYSGVKAIAGGYGSDSGSGFDWIGNAYDDYMNVGKNKYQGTPYQPADIQYGGQYGADELAKYGLDQSKVANRGAGWAQGQAGMDRGPQAMENQALADRESAARYGDQAGALQLSREAAMGLAPSQAAYQLQAGLDRGLANNQAVAGSARGLAGLSLAGANANASAANMNSQAYTEAGRLRAQEMGEARGLYGNLAGQQRGQDQSRLQMGNQMSQFNAGLNDQYRLGMGNLANQYNQSGQGWYTAAMNPYNQQTNADIARQQISADSYNQNEARRAGVAQANTDARAGQTDRLYGLLGSSLNMGGQAAAAGIAGSKKP